MGREIEKLIEYRQVDYSAFSEASSYVTNQQVDVSLRFSNPLICRMLTGSKIMKVGDAPEFYFSPTESVLVPPDMGLAIQFPTADLDNPTNCLCIEMERNKVYDIIARINEVRSKSGSKNEVTIDWSKFAFFNNDQLIDEQFSKLFHLFADKRSEFREMLIETGITDLIIRLLQAQSRRLLIRGDNYYTASRIDDVAVLIKRKLEIRHSSEELAKMACMSKASFFRHFKSKFGVSPVRFANEARIHEAKKILGSQDCSITQLAFELGFASAGHFVKLFRQIEGFTPGDYRKNAKAQLRQ